MSYDDYREFRRLAMDHLVSGSTLPPGPDQARDMTAKGQGWAMLALAEAIRDATDALNR